MKGFILGALLLLSNTSFSQWILENVDNGFDDPYKICYSEPSKNVVMKLENVENKIVFYLSNGYFCDKETSVDISFLVAGFYKKYTVMGQVSSNAKSIFLTWDLVNVEFIEDFKSAGAVKIRVNESYCSTDIYQFSMNNSKKALDFVLSE